MTALMKRCTLERMSRRRLGEAGDEFWSAVYYASARSEDGTQSVTAIGKISGIAEKTSGEWKFRQSLWTTS